jgi:hypothetical protein
MATRKKRGTKRKSSMATTAAIGRAVLAERRKNKDRYGALHELITVDVAEALRSVVMELALNGDDRERALARCLAPLGDALLTAAR